ncbi:hypothetical protein M514_08300 [Trichuris suis]|uniref:ER membrane protein complex subunit 7 beta-sandwich domain-containing protein n=1 Tax=Trichuris suis TaxID=68888 RepID=A0A085M0W6_9BILA|nr:hypothetical protein M513_08300 [Trichuris suis]KFD68942.1 hypothetical protein M514_08300 [Trichuris suis]KHJ46604.1 hypothetical protein D918_02919 [Trichuris suis]
MKIQLFLLSLAISGCVSVNAKASNQAVDSKKAQPCYSVEGRVVLTEAMRTTLKDWQTSFRILVDYGKYVGLIRSDGKFVVHCVAPGSYVVEVANANAIFEAFRVDLTSKGKIRARRLNYVQPSMVVAASYPLIFVVKSQARYFRQRERWRITDFLLSPMVLMMLLFLFVMIVFPKLANLSDPEVQREIQQQQQAKSRYEVPDLSDLMADWLVGKRKSKKRKT